MHVPVLLNEAIKGLAVAAGDIFVDATLGGGGHSAEVCRLHGRSVRIIAIDRDNTAIERARGKLSQSECDVVYVSDNFRNLKEIMDDLSISAADKFLFDLGFSSDQVKGALEEGEPSGAGRGFSFMRNEPLIMTYEASPSSTALTAEKVVNEWSEEELYTLLKELGEERYSRAIAKAIVINRVRNPIQTTGELRRVIEEAVPPSYRKSKLHPATRTFQALRITVNGELTALKDGLTAAWERLNPDGRIAVISFHSLEDRIVKQYFRELAKKEGGVVLSKKPIIAGTEELADNPRARSAKLRIIRKEKTKEQSI